MISLFLSLRFWQAHLINSSFEVAFVLLTLFAIRTNLIIWSVILIMFRFFTTKIIDLGDKICRRQNYF